MNRYDTMNRIKNTAFDCGYAVKYYDYSKLFFKFVDGNAIVQGHWNVNDNAFSVRTELKHPYKGNTSLWRNHLELEDVLKVITNPRQHIGKPVIYEKQ